MYGNDPETGDPTCSCDSCGDELDVPFEELYFAEDWEYNQHLCILCEFEHELEQLSEEDATHVIPV